VILANNDIPGTVGQEREWDLFQRLNSVPHQLLEILTTLPYWHSALRSAHEPILVGTMPGVIETFNSVIDEMTHVTDFKLLYLLHAENGNLPHEDMNTSIHDPENRWNIHVVLYDTLTSRAKPSTNGQLSHYSWSFGIFDESHQYKTKNRLGWRIGKNTRIGFKLWSLQG